AKRDTARLKQSVDDACMATAENAAIDTQAAKEKDAWDPAAEGKAFLERHAEVRQALIEVQNASTNFSFGRLYKPLGLTPAEIERLQALWREMYVFPVLIDGKWAALSTGAGMSVLEINRATSELLGKERFKRYSDSFLEAPVRQITQEVAK